MKVLEGLLPICAACKKIRDDKGGWHQMENYITNHSNAVFFHGYCPQCAKKVMEEAGLMSSDPNTKGPKSGNAGKGL